MRRQSVQLGKLTLTRFYPIFNGDIRYMMCTDISFGLLTEFVFCHKKYIPDLLHSQTVRFSLGHQQLALKKPEHHLQVTLLPMGTLVIIGTHYNSQPSVAILYVCNVFT